MSAEKNSKAPQFTLGQRVLVPDAFKTAGGSRLGTVIGVITRVIVRRLDGTDGYFEPENLEPAHWCPEPDCQACVEIDKNAPPLPPPIPFG